MKNIPESKEQFVRPVKLNPTPLSYEQIVQELKNIFSEQKDIDSHLFNTVLENSRFKTKGFLELNPVSYTCDLLREVLKSTFEDEQDPKLREYNLRLVDKSVNHIKDLFLNLSYDNKVKSMYVFFAYVLGMLENLDIKK